tara:strand:+ start:259 stop:420 length:162 start_codon:yes stop_codon:yes gene_type:complete
MTEYDIFPVYEKIINDNKITSVHYNNGIREIRYADGTLELYKEDKLIKKRGEK